MEGKIYSPFGNLAERAKQENAQLQQLRPIAVALVY